MGVGFFFFFSFFDVMNPIYCSLQDRFASSHGKNHIPLQEISDRPPLICVPGLQDVCTIETAVQDLQGEWTRWRPRAFSGVDGKDIGTTMGWMTAMTLEFLT